MSDQEVNRILAEFEGNDNLNFTFRENSYTKNFTNFNRVFIKFCKMKGGLFLEIHDLTKQPTPSQAAHQLAEIIKKEK